MTPREWDGRPQNPDRDGWHWLAPAIDPTLPPGAYRWHAPPRADVVGMWDGAYPKDMVRRGYTYLAPCLTPEEQAALLAERDAAVEKERAANSIIARIWQQLGSPTYEQLAGRSIYDLILEMQEQRDAARAEAARLREALETLAAQDSGVPGSTARADCMAALARATLAGEGAR